MSYYSNSRKEVFDLIPDHRKIRRILEVGCGEGAFKKNFNEKVEYWGIEPIEKVAKDAQILLDRVLIGFYEDVENQIPDNYFDLIVCNDVIEHVIQDEDLLLRLKEKLKDEGLIVGSIPNVRFITNIVNLIILKDWKYKDSGILDRTHLRFYTKKSIYRLFKKCNLNTIKIAGINKLKKTDVNNVFGFILCKIFGFFLGSDTNYMQYGFIINKKL